MEKQKKKKKWVDSGFVHNKPICFWWVNTNIAWLYHEMDSLSLSNFLVVCIMMYYPIISLTKASISPVLGLGPIVQLLFRRNAAGEKSDPIFTLTIHLHLVQKFSFSFFFFSRTIIRYEEMVSPRNKSIFFSATQTTFWNEAKFIGSRLAKSNIFIAKWISSRLAAQGILK